MSTLSPYTQKEALEAIHRYTTTLLRSDTTYTWPELCKNGNASKLLGDIIYAWLEEPAEPTSGPILRLQNAILKLEERLGVSLAHVNCQQIVFGDSKHILNAVQLLDVLFQAVDSDVSSPTGKSPKQRTSTGKEERKYASGNSPSSIPISSSVQIPSAIAAAIEQRRASSPTIEPVTRPATASNNNANNATAKSTKTAKSTEQPSATSKSQPHTARPATAYNPYNTSNTSTIPPSAPPRRSKNWTGSLRDSQLEDTLNYFEQFLANAKYNVTAKQQKAKSHATLAPNVSDEQIRSELSILTEAIENMGGRKKIAEIEGTETLKKLYEEALNESNRAVRKNTTPGRSIGKSLYSSTSSPALLHSRARARSAPRYTTHDSDEEAEEVDEVRAKEKLRYGSPKERLYKAYKRYNGMEGSAGSRLRPLAKSLFETTCEAALRDARPHTHHYRAAMDLLTAAERRKSTQNMKQLNALLSDYDLTRDVATQRLKQELETESHRRAARTKAWEVDALTRAFRSNAFAKREEKEVARLVRQQFDQVAHLLEQKRIGLNHYYHDQFQIVKENVAQQNKMKELHAKNAKSELRELQKYLKDLRQQSLQHARSHQDQDEERYRWRLQEIADRLESKKGCKRAFFEPSAYAETGHRC